MMIIKMVGYFKFIFSIFIYTYLDARLSNKLIKYFNFGHFWEFLREKYTQLTLIIYNNIKRVKKTFMDVLHVA